MQVKILKQHKRPDTWYNNSIGKVYEIIKEYEDCYFTRNEDTEWFLGIIFKEDSEKICE